MNPFRNQSLQIKIFLWNACTGEDITGSLDYQITIYYNENGDFTGGDIIHPPGAFFGVISGEEYKGVDNNVSISKSFSVKMIIVNLKMQLQGPVGVTHVLFHMKLRVMQKGQTINDFANLTSECY